MSERDEARLDRVGDVVQALTRTPRFRTFVTLLVATELMTDLRGRGPWVVLAPAESAFARLPSGWLERHLAPSGIETLVDLVENHVCRAPRSGGPLVSLLGERVAVRGGELAARRRFLRPDCANGTVIEVDHLRLPPWLRSERPPPGSAACARTG